MPLAFIVGQILEHEVENYPNVPMTRVETCVLLSEVNFASPKSDT